MRYFHDALIALAAKEIGIELIGSFDRDFDNLSWLRRIEFPEQIDELLT